jgi:hypothetical protein
VLLPKELPLAPSDSQGAHEARPTGDLLSTLKADLLHILPRVAVCLCDFASMSCALASTTFVTRFFGTFLSRAVATISLAKVRSYS